MKTNLFIATLFLTLLISCKKKTETQTSEQHDKISQTLLPYLFDNGSYWVYQDTSTNSIDSIVLSTITRSTFIIPHSPGDVEYFNVKYYSFLSGGYYDEQLLGYVISRGFYNGGYILLSSKTIGDKSKNAEIINVFDSLKIAGNTYTKVVKMKIIKDDFIDDNYNFYFADSVGVIRKEKINNDTITQAWNLLSSKINMYKYQ